jgi:ribonuclease P protein component
MSGRGVPLSPASCETSQNKVSDVVSSGRGQARFTAADRIRRRRDFLAAQTRGKRLHTPHFGVCLAPGPTDHPRLGLVVTKRLGKAVRRNRVKRLVREFFRRHKGALPPADIIIMAKKGAAELSYEQVYQELAPVLLIKSAVKQP